MCLIKTFKQFGKLSVSQLILCLFLSRTMTRSAKMLGRVDGLCSVESNSRQYKRSYEHRYLSNSEYRG